MADSFDLLAHSSNLQSIVYDTDPVDLAAVEVALSEDWELGRGRSGTS